MQQQKIDQSFRATTRKDNFSSLGSLSPAELEMIDAIQEQLGHVLTWPAHILKLMLQPHLRFNERCSLTFWLLANRLPPLMIAEWYVSRGMLRDKSARDHVASIVLAHRNGSLESTGKTAYVMNATQNDKLRCDRRHDWDGIGNPAEDRVQLIATPEFASHYQHSHFWDAAVSYLKQPPPPLPKRARVS